MPSPNRFLQGSFAPVSEEITAFDLPVTGRVPTELNGRYLRNGPGGRANGLLTAHGPREESSPRCRGRPRAGRSR